MNIHRESILCFAIVSLILMPVFSDAQGMEEHVHHREAEVAREDLEAMALQNNPTLIQAAEAVVVAEGQKVQSGLYPNPMIGYSGDDIAFRTPGKQGKHYIFLEHTFITGSKLDYAMNIFGQKTMMAEIDLNTQKQKVLNTVRMFYYEAVGAQRLVDLYRKLAQITAKAVTISEDLYNIGQADRPDVLTAEIEAMQTGIELLKAENQYKRIWEMLTAVVGNPSLQESRLRDNLEEDIPKIEKERILEILLRESLQIKGARARVEQARAMLQSAVAERIPNISLRLGLGYNVEEFNGGRVGAVGLVELGMPLPIFNRNQGNITSAQAELRRAEQEVKRLELNLRSSFSVVYADYLNFFQTVERYRKEILPRAKNAYDLYLTKFREMAASYPQVLITQRTFLQVQAEYVRALVGVLQNAIKLQGMLLTGGLESPVVLLQKSES